MCFCYENRDFCMGGADSCILSNPLWQNTLSLWAALPQSMSSSSSAKTASKTSSQTPKLCIKCRTKIVRGYFLQLGFGKMMLLAELLHFFEYGCSFGKLMQFLTGISQEHMHMI